MKFRTALAAAALMLGTTSLAPVAHSQALSDPVVAHPDPESLFTSKDPKLNRNKQVALKIVKELLEAGHWDKAPLYLTKEYIQHNPLAASGLDAVMHYFVDVAKVQPKPIPDKMKTKVVAVQAEGDYVTVLYVRDMPNAADPSKSYTTTWFDTWRFKDGKADEHWDPATLPNLPPKAPMTDADVLREAKDRAAITQLMWDYCRAIDGWKPDAYAAVFTPDGAFGKTKGREALRQMVVDLMKSQDERRAKGETIPAMHHFMANQNIEFIDKDHARVHYYWQTVFATSSLAEPPKLAAAGHGVDDVVRVDGKWFISNRNVTATD